MPVRLARLLPVLALALVALLALPIGALGAKTTVERAQTMPFFTVRGTHGWRLQVSGLWLGPDGKEQSLGVEAVGPDHQTVQYETPDTHVTSNGAMDARLPGVGHIDVRFETTERHTIHIENPKNCTSAPTAVDRNGVFRGTIQFHGEGGYTTVQRTSAPGEISTYPRQTCHEPSPKQSRKENEVAAEESEVEALFAERRHGFAMLSFTAISEEIDLPGFPPHQVEFSAEFQHRRDGMRINERSSARGGPRDFSTSGPSGETSEAVIEPPAPFKGNATFKLESPTTASWSGDLRAPVPTLGMVDLTGGAFGSTICTASGCSETLPSGVSFGILAWFSGPNNR